MNVELVDTPAEFLRRTSKLRAEEPVLTSVVGSIVQSVLDGRTFEQCWWWLVTDDAGEPVACAMRTAPWHLVLGPLSVDAAVALGRAVATADTGRPGVLGARDAAQALIGALPGPPAARVTLEEIVCVLDELVDPPAVPGQAVVAGHDQVDLLVDWHEQFARDAGLPARDLERSVRQRVDEGGLYWWQVDGAPVSMAGHVAPLATQGGAVARIGPVFTPQRFRRRGYGAAVTAEVVRRLRPRCSTVMLFTDAANPTSNGVYERLGFRPVAELVEVTLDPAR